MKPYARNARTHSKKQIKQIADPIRRFGFTNPVLIDRENIVITSSGSIEIRGPMTKEEKQQLELWRQQVDVFEAELAELRPLVGDPDCPDQQEIIDEIARTEKALEILAVVLQVGRIPATFPEIKNSDFGQTVVDYPEEGQS